MSIICDTGSREVHLVIRLGLFIYWYGNPFALTQNPAAGYCTRYTVPRCQLWAGRSLQRLRYSVHDGNTKGLSYIIPHRYQCILGRLQCQRLASAHRNHLRREPASGRLRLASGRRIVASERQIDYFGVVLDWRPWPLLASSLRLRISGSELKRQESERHRMEWESRRAISREWVHRRLVQELVRLLRPLPRLEFGSQKERQIHKLGCGIQPQRHQSHLHHDLVRRVYERLIATQAFWHLLQHCKLVHHNLSCCQHPRMKFETQIAASRQGFGYCHR